MPSGKVHDLITVVAAAVAVPAYWLAAPVSPADYTACGLLVGGTLFSGLMLSPDLDLDSSIYQRWGLMRFLWWPYQKAIPHRSKLSHSFVLAPLLRIAYFALIFYGLFRAVTWGLSFVLPMDRNALSRDGTTWLLTYFQQHPHHLHMLLLGLFLGPALHVAADLIVSWVKKRW